jgi:hypothetical protein
MTQDYQQRLSPCPFCGAAVQWRAALWPSEGDRDAIIHAEPTGCGLSDFSDDTFDQSIVAKWNERATAPAPASAVNDEWLVPNLVMFIRRMARRLRKFEHPDHKSTAAALDFIERKGIGGSILRDDES